MGASQTNSDDLAFQLWKEHSSQGRTDSALKVWEILRQTHPGYHITRVGRASCPLFNYAETEFATAVVDEQSGYFASRAFTPARRIDAGVGELADSPFFDRRHYTWDDKEFIVYYVGFSSQDEGCNMDYYILAPEAAGSAQGRHHPDTDALIKACTTWAAELHDEIEVFDDARWRKSKALYNSIKGSSWDDVILDPAMKANLIRDVQDFFNNRDIYRTLKVPWKRGVILHGMPGNGKTISIKALINSLASRPDPVPSLYVKSLDASRGSKWSIRSIFEHARSVAPCLLIFEDLDSMVEDKVRSYFLNEVDGLESNEGILMIGSTNHLSKLDPAITKRPSRFDRKYLFALPGEMERTLYCQSWRKKFEGSDAVDFPEELCPYIAKLTDGFSFAYMQELFVTSLLSLARGTSEDDESLTPLEEEESKAVGADATASEEIQSSEAKEGGDKKEAAGIPAAKPKRKLPQVDIPEAQGHNRLFGIFRAQAEALLREMDTSDAEKVKAKGERVVKVTEGVPMQRPIGSMQAMPIGLMQAMPMPIQRAV